MEAVCYKCKAKYKSSDQSDIEGDGFCSECLKEKKRIADEVDAKFANRPLRPTRTGPTIDNLPTFEAGGRRFIRASDIL